MPEPLALACAVPVWRIDIAGNLHLLDKCSAVLTGDEQQRANKYHHQKDQHRFILARGILRFLLALYSGQQAADIRFTIGGNKKPVMVQSGPGEIHYNVSHAGNMILIAFGNSPVGIDVANIDPSFDYAGILHDCFSDEEAVYIQLSPDPMRTFFQLWSRKEALLKATGKGIDDDLKLVPCVDGFHRAPAAVAGCETDMMVDSFDVGDSYVGSSAVKDGAEEIVFVDSDIFLRNLPG